VGGVLVGAALLAASGAWAQEAASAPPSPPAPDPFWAVHAQATVTEQGTLAFPSDFRGPQSLDPATRGRETVDVTLFAGVRPWSGAEIWINPEIDQGYGLNNTLGVAGFPSAEAYKVGDPNPYLKLPRLFLRQTIDLGGKDQTVDADANQMAGHQTDNRLVLWIGKFAVTDVFDTNKYAHDPKNDFLNWTLVDTGSFDYAADAWGYTVGTAAEWYQGPITLRAGAFDLSKAPNSEHLDWTFSQFQLIGEAEARYDLFGQGGKIAVTGFLTRGRMGKFDDAIALAEATDTTPSTGLVRHYHSRTGLSVNLEQSLTSEIALFARAGFAGGDIEPYEFTDVDDTAAAGLSFAGKAWGRADDTIGLAGVINDISAIHRAYLADGGLGILVGDGKLPRSAPEQIVETYYSLPMAAWITLTFDAQLVVNPAYNPERGPAPVLAARLHGHF
jgi:high affinity Mn2+ porin